MKLSLRLGKFDLRILYRLLLLGASLVFAIALAEVTVRVVDPQPPSWLHIVRAFSSPPYYALQRNLRWVCDTGESRWTLCTDNDGYRTSAQAPPVQRANRVRALLLGDSFTMGNNVDYEDSFAGILEQSEDRYHFSNAGVATYGPVEYRQILELEVSREPLPAMVIVTTFLGNDFYDCLRKQVSSPEWILSQPGGLRNLAKRHVHLYRLIAKCWHRLLTPEKPYSQREADLFDAPMWEQGELRRASPIYEREFARMAQICGDKRIKLCACIIPTETAVDAAEGQVSASPPQGRAIDYALPARRAGSLFEKLRIPYVDTTLSLATRGRKNAFFRYDGHLTPLGNRIVADDIRAKLLNLDAEVPGQP